MTCFVGVLTKEHPKRPTRSGAHAVFGDPWACKVGPGALSAAMKGIAMIFAERYHDISCGHRVHNHESKCAHLHGHNYRVTFACRAPALDSLGRVIDFSVIKEKLCMWLEDNWDHKFLAWVDDPFMAALASCIHIHYDAAAMVDGSIVWVPFNPTAENMAQYLVDVVGPAQLEGTGVMLISCRVEETRKCSATFILEE